MTRPFGLTNLVRLPRSRRLSILVRISALSLISLAGLTAFRLSMPEFPRFDAHAGAWLANMHSEGLIRFLVLLTEAFDPVVMLVAAAGAAAVLLIERRFRLAAILAASLSLGAVSFTVSKLVFRQARPEGAFLDVPGFGYPSGHATIAVIVFMFLSYLYVHITRSRHVAALFHVVNLCMIVGVGVSRVYLGVHWPSDVLAGFLLGIFCFTSVLAAMPRDIHRIN